MHKTLSQFRSAKGNSNHLLIFCIFFFILKGNLVSMILIEVFLISPHCVVIYSDARIAYMYMLTNTYTHHTCIFRQRALYNVCGVLRIVWVAKRHRSAAPTTTTSGGSTARSQPATPETGSSVPYPAAPPTTASTFCPATCSANCCFPSNRLLLCTVYIAVGWENGSLLHLFFFLTFFAFVHVLCISLGV